jgi:hypothetical protein
MENVQNEKDTIEIGGERMALRDENGRKLAYNSYERRVRPNLALVEGLARHGATDTAIAERLGVSISGFSKWKTEHYELDEALERGREFTDTLVENALLKRALGCLSVEITKERKAVGVDDDGETIYKLVPTKKVYKQVLPDVGAAQYWLENRMGSRWTKHPAVEIDDNEVNRQISSVAELMMNPVAVRTGAEDDD